MIKLLTVAALFLSISAGAQIVVLQKSILFPSRRWTVQKDEARLLDHLLDSLKADSSLVILLEGNSDSAGSYRMNCILSGKRALSVKKMLLRRGVAENIITLRSWGPDRPRADNGTREGRRLNRRVDLTVSRPTPVVVEKADVPDIAE